MTARCVAARRLLFSPLLPLALVASALCVPGCYGGGQGTDPPRNTFYFPAGLAVSKGGNALYAANSDFDLQWNGGTLQSYDLYRLRHDIDAMILANLGVPVPGVTGSDSEPLPICSPGAPPAGPTVGWCVPVLNSSWRPADCNGASTDTSAIIGTNGSRNLLGETCAPPVASDDYQQSSWIIGAFATQLVLSSVLTSDGRRRLFSPIGGNASVTWADVPEDSPTKFPHDDLLALFQSSQDGGAPPSAPPGTSTFDPNHPELLPFAIDCRGPQDTDPSGRCGASHQAGNTLDDPRNSRNLTLPGEPFALALTLDNSAIAVAHQTSGETSLLLSGLGGDSLSFQLPDGGFPPDAIASTPSMQFVLEGVPSGGDGITAVPHDDSLDSPAPGCEFFPNPPPPTCVRPSFLETNNTTAEIDLLRYYNDLGSSISRPFLDREAVYPLTALEGGTDSRGIVVDPTPRLQCRHAVSEAFQTAVAARVPMSPALQGAASTSEGADEEPPVDPCPIDPGSDACAQWIACGTVPSRVFFATRTPPALVTGHIGGPSASGDGSFDPDRLTIGKPVALGFSPGPSTVYLAPIVNRIGRYELRVFIVGFDANRIFVYNPVFADTANPEQGIENTIDVGAGPFAMAFDPFDMQAVAQNALVLPDTRQVDSAHLKVYRFGYVALFTNSYLQVIDLDDSLPDVSARTFENVVFSLGQPTIPKGT